MDSGKQAEAEAAYIAGSMTLRELAGQMGIPFSTVSRWSKQGKWVEKRQGVNRRAARKAVTKAVNKKARQLQKLLEASGEMEKALLAAARLIRRDMEKDTAGLLTSDRFRAGNLQSVVNAIGRQAETRMLLSGILTAADREKIDLMRRKQEWDESRGDGTQGGVVVEMGEDVQNYAE